MPDKGFFVLGAYLDKFIKKTLETNKWVIQIAFLYV